jgi:uncharacterized protein YecE (DUF72 family)
MRVRIGTSGFSYKEWRGTFYPEKLPEAKMLSFYGERFDTVEINNTYYRMPKPSVFEGWAREVQEGFSFVLKAPLSITHLRKGAELADPAAAFFRTAATLRSRLGPVLLQLPPYLKKDRGLLRAFFELVPKDVRVAVEVTPTWHDDDIYALLSDLGAALCIVDDPKKRTPLVPTASWGYLRLRETTYGEGALRAWADKVRTQPWDEAWVFFKHEDAATGPRLGVAFRGLFGLPSPPMAAVVHPPS